MILGVFLLVIALSFFTSAQVLGCAEKTTSGAWCQQAEQKDAASGYSWAPTSCDQASFCQKGTCVNENSGTCASNTPKNLCIQEGGVWDEKDKDEILECRPGCCVLGQEVAFVNEPTCQQLATDYGVNVNFRKDIQTQDACFALDTTEDEGACVIESETGTDCKRTTQSGCTPLGGIFNKGLLCSAPGLSDCAKDSTKTVIKDDKVYFVDTCGNKANVYDESRFEEANYWEEIQEPICSVGGNPSSTCGDCSYRLGTIAAEYKSGDPGMPKGAPKYGENVCKDLACFYDTNDNGKIDKNEEYLHGESWCAESPGTYPHVPFFMDALTKNEIANGFNKYNLPGSRYNKLKCYDGEVIVEPCKDFRNSVCQETVDPVRGKSTAQCIVHEGANCLTYGTRSSCEERDDCKWIPGYTIDGKLLDNDLGKFAGEKYGKLQAYDEYQGSCSPIFASGTEFWLDTGEAVCNNVGNVEEHALFETGVGTQRENFAEDDVKKAAEKCIDGCYSIPGYGKDGNGNYYDIEDLKAFQLAGFVLDNAKDSLISQREGYYCKKDPDEADVIDNTKTGGEGIGNGINCATDDGKDLERRRVKPFYTHEQWLGALAERTRSIGDCGYKPHAYGGETNWEGDPESEKITAIFQILKQDKTERKLVGESKTIYSGSNINEGVPIPNSGYRNL